MTVPEMGFRSRRRNDSSTLTSTGMQSRDLNPRIGYYAYDSLNDLLLNRLDGQNLSQQLPPETRQGNFHISIVSNNGNAIAYGFNGWVGEVIVIDALSSAETRQKVEAYLAWKWGLEGNLENDHPYKNIAP